MKVLAIDPGSQKTGFSIFFKNKTKPELLNSGTIKLPRKKSEIFKTLFKELTRIVEEEKPDEIALESSFYGKNPQTLIRLGEIRGVILLVASLHSIPVYEYTPQQVKNAITGYGWSKKEEVSIMVEKMFNKKVETFDEADAIAVGFCHCLYS